MTFDPSKLNKVELHVHLDTCLSYHYVKKANPQITRAAFNRQFIAPKRCADLGDFKQDRAANRPLADMPGDNAGRR